VDLLSGLFEWFLDPSNWSGDGGIPRRTLEHLQISTLALVLATVIGLPAGLFIGHTGRGAFFVTSVANFGRAIPSFAVVGLAVPFSLRMGLGMGFWPTLLALFLLGIPPILTNSYVGVQEIERDTLEAARGMGMTGWEVLRGIELPLASPLIVVGLRVAMVQIVATATLAALVAGGGLGRFIIHGFAIRDFVEITGGALLVALLAIVVELAFGVMQKIVSPHGLFIPAQGIAGRTP
jgi:osmoprotectant transport system permease protein